MNPPTLSVCWDMDMGDGWALYVFDENSYGAAVGSTPFGTSCGTLDGADLEITPEQAPECKEIITKLIDDAGLVCTDGP